MKRRPLFACFLALEAARSQRLDLAIHNGGNDVVRREHYEYHAPRANAGPRPFDGLVPGLLLTLASSYLEWWNEGRAVGQARLLKKAEQTVVELDGLGIDEANEGKLVHIISAELTTDTGVVDQEFGLRRPTSLQLFKTSEVYEWRESKSQRRTRVSPTETRVITEYWYDKRWGERHRDSNRFEAPSGHYNPPPNYFVGEQTFTAEDARLSNGLRVGPELVDQLTSSDLLLTLANSVQQDQAKASVLYRGHHHMVPVNLENLHLPSEEKAVVSSDKLYISHDIQARNQLGSNLLSSGNLNTNENHRIPIARILPSPQVGDVRVSWKEVLPPREGVSVLAKQQGDKLVPWSLGGGRHRIYSLLPGQHSAKEMIDLYITKNKFVTKALRIGGWLGTFLGLKLVLSCSKVFNDAFLSCTLL